MQCDIQVDRKIQDDTKNIIDLNNKLSEKSEYIEHYLTGGDGFVIVDMRMLAKSVLDTSEWKLNFYFQNDFEFLIYNIHIKVWDFDMVEAATETNKDDKRKFIIADNYNNAIILFKELSELAPKQPYQISNLLYLLRECRYYIVIHCRNKVVVEKFADIKVGNQHFHGFEIVDVNDGKILKEVIEGTTPPEIKIKLKERLKTIPHNLKYLAISES